MIRVMIERPETEALSPSPENVVGQRIIAGLIDVAILFVVFIVKALVFGDTEGDGSGGTVTLDGAPFLLYLAIVIAYYAAFELMTRRTPGKMVMGLRVESADAEELSAGRIVLRNLLRLIDGLPFLYIVGLISIAATKRDQRVGDIAGRTIVVRGRGSA